MDQPKLDKPLPKFRPNPLIASLPEHLKDPANYERIRRAIAETVQTTCTHGSIGEMAACMKCSDNMLVRRKLLKKLGFKNPAQYHAWQKIHNTIKDKFPLADWAKENEVRKALEQK